MTDEVKNAEINKLSVKNGLITGALSVVISLVLYFIDPLLQYTSSLVPFACFVVIIALIVILAIDTRKKIGGFWSFGQAYRSLIISALFIVLLSTVYNFAIFKFGDPALPGKIKDATLEKMTATFEKLGMDQTKIDKATEQFSNGEFEARLKPSFKNTLTNLGVGLLVYAIINLIIAAIIKKNPPMFAPVADELDE